MKNLIGTILILAAFSSTAALAADSVPLPTEGAPVLASPAEQDRLPAEVAKVEKQIRADKEFKAKEFCTRAADFAVQVEGYRENQYTPQQAYRAIRNDPNIHGFTKAQEKRVINHLYFHFPYVPFSAIAQFQEGVWRGCVRASDEANYKPLR